MRTWKSTVAGAALLAHVWGGGPAEAARVVGRVAVPAAPPGAAGRAPEEALGATAPDEPDAAARDWVPVALAIPHGHLPVRARARVAGWADAGGAGLPAECLGTTGLCGHQIALLRVRRPPSSAADSPGSLAEDRAAVLEVEVETAPGAAPAVLRRRFDPEQERRTRERLRRLVANPADVDAFAPPCPVPPDAPAGGTAKPGAGDSRSTVLAGPRGFQPTSDPSLDGSGVRYLIVTTEALAPTFQALADWKTRRGMPAAVRTIEWIESRTRRGIDRAETIRNFLVEAYALWGIEYVLLGGDTAILPARFAWSAIYGGGTSPTDLYFSCLDGTWNADGDDLWGEGSQTPDPGESDMVPELAVARATVNNLSEAQIFVQRVVAYELPLFADYQTQATFLAEVLIPANWDSGMAVSYNGAVGSEQMINESLPAAFTTQRLYDTYWLYPGSERLTKAASIAAMNAGTCLVNQLGHGFRYTMSLGDASLVNADADALQNGGRTFLLVMANCAAVAFDYNCLAERFLLNSGGGAVAVIGAARSVSASLIVTYNRAIYRQMFPLGHAQVADALNEARLERVALAETDGSDRWIQFSLNVLGDPELTVWSGAVRTAQLAHPDTLLLGADTLDVHVAVDSAAVPGVRVCAQKGDEVYAVAWADSLGDVRLPVAPESPGDLYVTISGQNVATRTDTLHVLSAAEPILVVGAVLVDEDGTPPSIGNGDGSIDAGETLELQVQVLNQGGSAADSVTGVVTSLDPRVVVLQESLTVGTVGSGNMQPGTPAVVVQVDAGIPDGTVVELEVALRDTLARSWTDRVRLLVCAPRLEVTRAVVTPDTTAGMTHRIAVEVKNFGSGWEQGLVGTLAPLDSTVVVAQDTTLFAPLAPMAVALGAPEFLIADTTVTAPPLALTLRDSYGRTRALAIDRVPPPAPALPTADLTVGAGIVRLTWPVSSAPDRLGYHVFRASVPDSFVRLTPDAVHHTDFYDTAALPNSHYDYRVVAVDSSMQWSDPSPTLGVNTTAAPISPWPLDMSEATQSSVAIGDLDGDSFMEVVVGDGGVYAWHADGQEVLDGDGNGTTHGVFSTATGAMLSSVALADLDGQLGLEIVAASWLTNRIYAWNARAELQPGWPREPANGGNPGYWGSPAIGDVDGDGGPEIAIVSKDGWLYCWHADGTPLLPGNGAVKLVGAWTQTTPALADLDGDGRREIIVSGALAKVWVLRWDGTDFPGWPVTLYALGKGSPAVGDVDGDGDLEIVITSESNHVYVFASDGTTLPGWPKNIPQDAPDFGPSPALGDMDGDGRAEVVVVSVKSPTWSQSKLYVFSADGDTLLAKSLELNAQSSPVLADLDGDGGIDIVHGGEAGVLHAWNLAGQELPGFPIPIGDWIRGTPMYCDLDRDGRGDLVLAGWNKKVYAWRMTGTYRRDRAPWPAFHGNLLRDGFLPRTFPTDVPPPEPEAAPLPRRLAAAWSPNPFNPTVALRLEVPGGTAGPMSAAAPAPVPVTVELFDVHGRLLRRLLEAPLPPGTHRLVWNGRDDRGRALPSGIYFYRVRAGGQTVRGKLALVR